MSTVSETQISIRAQVFEAATKYYQSLFEKSEKAQEYCKKRGHSSEDIQKFRIGWTGTDRTGLYKFLISLPGGAFHPDELVSSGLIKKWEDSGNYSDCFDKELIVFPKIKDKRVNHFRIKDPDKKRKYQLPAEYNINGQLLYNQDDLRFSRVIIVEGENDTISVKREIEKNKINAGVVGCMQGITYAQIELLTKNYQQKEFFCFFDNDPAGHLDAERFIQGFPGGDISVIVYDKKIKDPDDYFRFEAAEPIEHLLRDAKDGIVWLIERLPDADSALNAKKHLKPVFEIVAKIKDTLYIEMLIDDGIRKKYPSISRKSVVELLKQSGANLGPKVQSFEVYDSTDMIMVSDNCFWIPGKDGEKRRISNFQWRLVNIFYFEDSFSREKFMKYEAVLVNYKGIKSEPVLFEPDERVTVQKFVSKCATQGEFHFHGNLQDLMNCWSFVESTADHIKKSYMFQKYGFLEYYKLWLFANCAVVEGKKVYPEKNGVIDVNGSGYKSMGVSAYSGDKPVMYLGEIDQKFREMAVKKIWQLCDGVQEGIEPLTFRGILLLGFVAAMVYRNDIMRKFGFFPMFCNYGPPETGKTFSTHKLFKFWGFMNTDSGEGWSGQTPAGQTQLISQFNSMPIWIDEHKTTENKRYKNEIYGIWRSVYNGSLPQKGGLKGMRTQYDAKSCLWVSGEHTFDDKATLSRFMINRFDEVTEVRKKAGAWFDEAEGNVEKLSGITLKLIVEKTSLKKADLFSQIEVISQFLKLQGITDNRTRLNLAIPAAAFYLFGCLVSDDFENRFFAYLEKQAKEELERKAGEDIVLRILEDMLDRIYKTPFSNFLQFIPYERKFAFAYKYYMEHYQKELHDRGDDLLKSISKQNLLDYVRKYPAIANNNEDDRVATKKSFGGGRFRCYVIAFDILKSGELKERFIEEYESFMKNQVKL